MTEDAKTSRPVDLTSEQVKGLVSGKIAEFGEYTRPREITPAHLESLAKGKHIDLEKLPVLEKAAGASGLSELQTAQSAPLKLTNEEIEALRAGKHTGLEKRER